MKGQENEPSENSENYTGFYHRIPISANRFHETDIPSRNDDTDMVMMKTW